MKELIKEKFVNQKHKWIWFYIDSHILNEITNTLTSAIANKQITSKNSIKLINCFKFHEKVFIKFIKTVGRKNFNCLCQIIDENNNKVEINLKPIDVINASILSGTPKSLKLYKCGKKDKNNWTKPDDGFVDPIEYPPVDEELTELGYQLYKEWQLEIQNSGMSEAAYKRKMFGEYTKFTRV